MDSMGDTFKTHNGQSIKLMMTCVVEDWFIRFHIDANQGMAQIDAILEDNGLIQFYNIQTDLDKEARYVIKDIAFVFREKFSNPYGTEIWGRDRFRITKSQTRENAIQELSDQMCNTFHDMTGQMCIMMEERLHNKYDESAKRIDDANSKERSNNLDEGLAELRAMMEFNEHNLKRDSSFEEEWNLVCKYKQVCTNFNRLFNLTGSNNIILNNCMQTTRDLHDCVVQSGRLELRHFELKASISEMEMSDHAQAQTASMDVISKFVAILTIVATALAVPQFVSGLVSQICGIIIALVSATVIGCLFLVVYARSRSTTAKALLSKLKHNHRIV